MAINDTIQQRLQAAPQGGGMEQAQAAMQNVAQTQETDPMQTVEELNQTAMALFMLIEEVKQLAQKVAVLEQGMTPPTQGV